MTISTTKRKPNVEKSLSIIKGSSVNEPKVTEESYNIDMVCALNWYGNQDDSKLRTYALQYAKIVEREECLPAIEKASDIEIHYIGAIGRLLLIDQYISEKHIDLVEDYMADLQKKYIKKTPEKSPIEKVIIDKTPELISKYGAEIDEQLDYYILNKKSDFSMKNFLLQNNINSTLSKKIGALYEPLLKEINDVVNNSDSELVEGYSNFSRWQIRKYATFIQDIINACNQHSESVKVKRTVRKVTVKPASVITAKVAYLKEFTELNLKSIFPSNIIGASELWVYNIKTRKIGVYYGADEGKLSVSGTTIINFDILKSVSKTLRKPEETFKTMGATSKRAMTNWFKTISSKPLPIKTGRLNSDTILITAN